MELLDKRNTIAYDAEKDELKIVTHYDKQQYKVTWIQDQCVESLKYLLKSGDPQVKNHPTVRMIHAAKVGLVWTIAIYTLFLCLFGIILIKDFKVTAFLLYLLTFALYIGFWIYFLFGSSIKIYRTQKYVERKNVFNQKQLAPNGDAIEQFFSKCEDFQQEVTITRDGHTMTTPYPDTPVIHSTRGQIYIRVVLDGDDLYFLQLESGKQNLKYAYSEAMHFAKRNYSPSDWALLISQLKAMNYLEAQKKPKKSTHYKTRIHTERKGTWQAEPSAGYTKEGIFIEASDHKAQSEGSAECWADLSPQELAHDRKALLAAWLAGRALRSRLMGRWGMGLAALAGLLGSAAWAMYALLNGTTVAWWAFLLPVLCGVVLLLALQDWPLRRQIRREWNHTEHATLYADRLHLETEDGAQDLPLADLALVQRFAGWTVLAWQDGPRSRIFSVWDETCGAGEEILYVRLQQAVPGVRFRHSWKPPRPRRHLILSLLAVLILLYTELMLVCRTQGLQLYFSHNESYDTIWMASRQGWLYSPDTGYFAYPAAGKPKFQWLSNRCCAVTYPATDGSIRVQLLESDRGKVPRLDPDPPIGQWRSKAGEGETPVTLRWEEENQCYHLITEEGEQIYRQWQDFDGLGLALCDNRGLPQWTVTPYFSVMDWLYSEQVIPTLELCPVSMEETHAVILYNAEAREDSDAAVSAPQFGDTVDVCVKEDGVFFTWDGGIGSSQVLDAEDCARCGIASEADLEPLVLRWDVASFLTVEEGQVFSYTTVDQGRTWEREQLLTLGSDTLTDRCYGFSGAGPGYAALSGTDANGTLWVKAYMSVDDGASWQRITTPVAADGVVRPLNGLCFVDGACGVATAPGDAGDPWPHVFTTMDCGNTWEEPDIPFADSGQTGAVRLADLYIDESGTWQVTFTQDAEGTREIVFETSSLVKGYWMFSRVHAAD